MFVDVKQYPNLIQTISFLLKSYKHSDRAPVSPTGNDETHGNLLETLLTLSILSVVEFEKFVVML
jgi:hypothetical protein